MKKLTIVLLLLLNTTYGEGTKNSDAAFNELECATGGECQEEPLLNPKMTRQERNRARRAAEAKNKQAAKEEQKRQNAQTQAPSNNDPLTKQEPAISSRFTPNKAQKTSYAYIGVAETEGSFKDTLISYGTEKSFNYQANKLLLGLFSTTSNMKLELGLTAVTLSDLQNNTAPAFEMDYDLIIGSGSTTGWFDSFYYLRLGLAINSITYSNYTTSGYGWRLGFGVDVILFKTFDLFLDYTYMSLKSMPENYQDPTNEERYGMVSMGLNYLF